MFRSQYLRTTTLVSMKYRFILFSMIALFSISCVSQKKYDVLQASKSKLQKELARLQRVERDCDQLRAEMELLQKEYEALETEKDLVSDRFTNLEEVNKDLMTRYDKLLDQNTSILSTSSEEKKALNEELAQKETQLDRKESELLELEKTIARKQSELETLRTSLEEREARIASLNTQLNAQKSILTGLKSRLSDALLGFSSADLTVTQKDGKVYVSMSQNLLFAKGSDAIDEKGKEAIQKVAAVLSQDQDVDIMVEGHTDTDGTAERNWDLSVTRATAVIQLLTKFGVDPKRITAAGRAYYAPVAPNDTEINKSKNRRTEIILSPRLSELFRLLND